MGGDQLSLVDFNYVPIFVALNMLKPIMPCDMLKEFKRVPILIIIKALNIWRKYNGTLSNKVWKSSRL